MLKQDIEITYQDFEQSNWENVIASSSRKECNTYHKLFDAKLKELLEKKENIQNIEVYKLLASITSFHFQSESKETPYIPMFQWGENRTPIPTDLTDNQLSILSQVIDDVKDAEIKARIADILWIRTADVPWLKPKKYDLSNQAVVAFLASATALENDKHWTYYVERVERALYIAGTLNNKNNLHPLFLKVIHFIESFLNQEGISYKNGSYSISFDEETY